MSELCACAGCRRQQRQGRDRAHAQVFWAKRSGRLALLDGAIPCEDCGQPATAYDHRDYARPLEVAPVCARCNHLRPPAQWLHPPEEP